VANRIGGASFSIDGKTYTLAANDGDPPRNHLHGGDVGFDKRVWSAVIFDDGDSAGVNLTLRSPDGEEGYPGNLDVAVRYRLTDDGELSFAYTAVTDAATPINLTNHAYWNLAGPGSGPIHDQVLTLHCPKYLVVDDGLIPTGEIAEVAATPMDFTRGKAMGADMADVPGGYDHCFIADDLSDAEKVIATVADPVSGRAMEIRTTKPAVQLYGGNFLDGTIVGKGGIRYDKHGGFCLETQFYPDSVHHENFPSTILRPGETYSHVTTHRFFTA
jgi:aldose 1-epimerase